MTAKFRNDPVRYRHDDKFPIIETLSQDIFPIKEIEQASAFRKDARMKKRKPSSKSSEQKYYPWLRSRLGERGNSEGKPTMADLARHLDINQSYITKLFDGTREIQIQRGEHIKIANYFGISIEEVLTGVVIKQQEGLTYADRALSSAFMVVMQAMLNPKAIDRRYFLSSFSALEAEYAPHKDAVDVLQRLEAFLSRDPDAPHIPEKQTIEKFLNLSPRGSA